MIRSLLGLLAALTLALTAAPAFAGPAENAFLASLVGNYIGKASVPDQNGRRQPVTCRLVVAGATAGKITYNGRCSISGGSFSMTGAIVFSGGKYLAAMTSSGGMSGNAVGQRHGNGVSFSSSAHDTMQGGDRNVASTLTLSPKAIRVEFTIRDNKNGKTTHGAIPFSKA